MLKNKIDPYAPCYCGSGKKYRFCCQHRIFEPSATGPSISESQYKKARKVHYQGYDLMGERKFEEAIPLFKKAVELNPDVPNSVNNLALCYFMVGNLDEALKIQRDFLKKSFISSAFGLANLSLFLYFNDEEAAAVNALYVAASQDDISLEAALKICEMFARLHRYQDLFEFAFSKLNEDALDMEFWAGCAAANVGDTGLAIEYLRRVNSDDPKFELAERYLELLEKGARPVSFRGDWPMLVSSDFYLERLLKDDKTLSNPVLKHRWVIDFVESVLNDPNHKDKKPALDVLKDNPHPEAAAFLKKLVSGSFGSDELRQYASVILLERGDIKSGEMIEMQHKGRKSSQQLLTIELDPKYEFCPLPEEFAGEYEKIVFSSHEENPDWEKIVGRYREMLRKYPDFFPAEYNLAVAIYNSGVKSDEPEKIVRRLKQEHPEYLFAHAMLLDILGCQEHYEEGMQLIKSLKMPEKTHPDALEQWFLAQGRFFLRQRKFGEAKSFLKVLESFPDDPEIDKLKKAYEECRGVEKVLKKFSDMFQKRGKKGLSRKRRK